ncbi:MAG TPA: F0F1 ATP synthase subunit A [Fimbriimonadaceae bacterium]|nr:F0F1 ATP synthase subunit A [Fimbriimonadaceae bacterium]HRJ32860.1 F0F1 ATP synthase subunit A [Fimbriimonadaceae bacterium]
MGTTLGIGSSLWAAGGGEHHGLSWLGMMVYIALVLGIVFFALSRAKQDFGQRVFKGFWSQLLEQVYLFIENLCVGIIGAHGRKYIPFILTFWLVIFVSNVVALFFPTSPTADLSFNLGVALIAIGYVQWEGMKANGVLGHFKHFAGPKLPPALLLISFMIFIIEIISEVMKNVSLSLRLFGNIEGGHQAVVAMNNLGGSFVPVGFLLMPIKILTCIVQALIFSLLTCVYLSLVTHHEDDHHHDEAGEPAGHSEAQPAAAH